MDILRGDKIMLFVTAGTQDKEFKRLFENVEKLIDKGVIKGEVVAQVGSTNFTSKNMKVVKFISNKKVLKYIQDSDYVICHGGVGTIIDSLNCGKKVIACARLKKFKEHVNDHQLEIVNEFAKEGYILDGTYDLENKINNLKKFKPKKYTSNNTNFVNLIRDFINNN